MKTHEINLTLHSNMGGDKSTLVAGKEVYVVQYLDAHDGKLKLAGATWNGKNFEFCPCQFVTPEVSPSFEKDASRHYIKGWCRLSEWDCEGSIEPSCDLFSFIQNNLDPPIVRIYNDRP